MTQDEQPNDPRKKALEAKLVKLVRKLVKRQDVGRRAALLKRVRAVKKQIDECGQPSGAVEERE